MGLELDDSSSGELDGARSVAGFDDEAGILYDPLPIVHPYQMPDSILIEVFTNI